MAVSNSVFISYRRDSGFAWAQLAWEDLTAHGIDAFLDLEALQDAGSFDHKILNQIAARPYFVPVLTPGSLERCVEPGDWLRREIEHAISIDRAVVPLIVGDFDFAEADRCLPGSTAQVLRNSNGVGFVPEYYREAMRRLREQRLQPLDRPVRTPSREDRQFAAEAQQRAIQATGVAHVSASPSPGPPSEQADTATAGEPPPSRSRRVRMIAAIGATSILLLGGLLLAVASSGNDTVPALASSTSSPTTTSSATTTTSSVATTTSSVATTTSVAPANGDLGAVLGPDANIGRGLDEQFVMQSETGGHTWSMTAEGALRGSTDGVPWVSQPAVDDEGDLVIGGTFWVVQPDGNLVLYDAGDQALWQSETADPSRPERSAMVTFEIRDDQGTGVLEIRVDGTRIWVHRAEGAGNEGEGPSATTPPTSTSPTTTTATTTTDTTTIAPTTTTRPPTFLEQLVGTWTLMDWRERPPDPVTLSMDATSGTLVVDEFGNSYWDLELDDGGPTPDPTPGVRCMGKVNQADEEMAGVPGRLVVDGEDLIGTERDWTPNLMSLRADVGVAFCGWTFEPESNLFVYESTSSAYSLDLSTAADDARTPLLTMRNEAGSFTWLKND